MKPIKCYLCDRNAQYEDKGHHGKLFHCDSCLWYQLTSGALLFYFERSNGKTMDSESKRKLSEYVKKNYDPEVEEAVFIDRNIIERETGLISMGQK